MKLTLNRFLLFFFTLLSSLQIAIAATDIVSALSKIQNLSSNITQIGKLAQGKLVSAPVKAYNDRMLKDHAVSMDMVADLSRRFNAPLPQAQEESSLSPLAKLSGKAFESEYLKKIVGEHSQYLSLLQQQILPAMQNPILKKALENFVPRISSLLSNAKALQK